MLEIRILVTSSHILAKSVSLFGFFVSKMLKLNFWALFLLVQKYVAKTYKEKCGQDLKKNVAKLTMCISNLIDSPFLIIE